MISALTGKYPCFGVKWFPLLFSLQSISGLRRAKRERDRERREIVNPETDSDFDSDEPRNRLRLTQKTQDRENPFVKPIRSHPENPFNRTISDPHRADRTTGEIVAPKHRSTQNQSFSSHPKTDRSRAIFVRYWEFGFCFLFLLGFVLDPASSSSTQIRCPHSSNLVASLSLSQFDRIWWIFFVGICFFCVYLLRNDINICLEDEKIFFRMQPNTWKYFPFPKNRISGKYLFSGKYFTGTKHSLNHRALSMLNHHALSLKLFLNFVTLILSIVPVNPIWSLLCFYVLSFFVLKIIQDISHSILHSLHYDLQW